MTLSDPCALSDLCPGVKNLAVQMSDPFGNDPIDFKLENFLASYYNNAIHFLADDFDSNGDDLPEGIQNPMDSCRGARKRMLSAERALSKASYNEESTGAQLIGSLAAPSGRNSPYSSAPSGRNSPYSSMHEDPLSLTSTSPLRSSTSTSRLVEDVHTNIVDEENVECDDVSTRGSFELRAGSIVSSSV